MIALKRRLTKVALVICMSFPQLLWANEFTASDVLKWGQEAQNSYFNTSVGMIAILAARTGEHGHVADCLNDWYWTDDGNDPKKNDLFREVMSTLGTYHPQAVILAVVEKHCGSFKPD